MVNKSLNQQQLTALCGVLADTSRGITKNEITKLLGQCQIEAVDDGYRSNGISYTTGLNKREWLNNCLANEFNKHQTFERIFRFVEAALAPVRFTDSNKRDLYDYLFEETNKVLVLSGLSIDKTGTVIEVVSATTLDEADRRVNNLKQKLYHRSIHNEVAKYCIKDYLRKDYYAAVFEAAKGLAERVRQLSGLGLDGSALFQTVFSSKDPYLAFNTLKTDSERSEFSGLKELCESIFHLVRNPAAHTPKINWKTDETKALDVLTLISFAHKYLDECFIVPGKS